MSGAVSVTVHIDQAKLHHFLRGQTGPVMASLLRLGNRVMNTSAERVNVDTGYLRSSREMIFDGEAGQVTVAYRANYAIFVHDGTRYMTGNPYLLSALQDELNR